MDGLGATFNLVPRHGRTSIMPRS